MSDFGLSADEFRAHYDRMKHLSRWGGRPTGGAPQESASNRAICYSSGSTPCRDVPVNPIAAVAVNQDAERKLAWASITT